MLDKFGFKLEIKNNLEVTDYLDITICPFVKNNQQPRYIDVG